MHAHSASLSLDELIRTEPIQPSPGLRSLSMLLIVVGVVTVGVGLITAPIGIFWAAFYTNLLFFMSVSCGSAILTAIFQVVRAKWAPPIRRIAEAGVSFFPWIYIGFLLTYFGKEELFFWAREPKPGVEWYMQPNFVYMRFAALLGLLFLILWRFVRLSLRGDVGLIRERAKDVDRWFNISYDGLVANWEGSSKELVEIQRTLSIRAPLVIMAYAVIMSLFAFEMVMAMNEAWVSNMYGGYFFVTSIYVGFATVIITACGFANRHPIYRGLLTTDKLWDIGKLTFAFCMFWGYLFFAQFLVQWYGNLPEETQWLIIRTREMPWKAVGWMTFGMCFVIPFITLLSRDVKRTPRAVVTVCMIIFAGIWLDRYLTVMPEVSPKSVPFGGLEVGMFLGFLGAYLLSVQNFVSRYPFISVSSPLTKGSAAW